MPTLTAARPIVPATYSTYAPDPATLSPGLVKRARRVAARAKALIEEHGWVQNQGFSNDGAMCISTAIYNARIDVRSKPGLIPLTSPEVENAVTGILEEARPKVTRRAPAFTSMGAVVGWNDKRGRTKEQVLELLAKAAEG